MDSGRVVRKHAVAIWWERRTEGSDVLAVLDELDTDTLANGGVGLLGLNTNLLEHDALGVRRATEGRRLEGRAEGTLLVREVGPLLVLAVGPQLPCGVETTRHFGWWERWMSVNLACLADRFRDGALVISVSGGGGFRGRAR